VSQPHFGLSVRVKPTLPKVGTWSPSGLPKTQKTIWGISSHRCALGIIGKVFKCRCPKWPRMSHLDICSPSYGQKKGRESKWQFDSRPLKVRNRPVPDVRSRSATRRWKALFEGYNFGLDLVPIGGRGEELRSPKVPGLQLGTVSGLHFGNPRQKAIRMPPPRSNAEYTIRSKVMAYSRVRAVMCLVVQSARGLSPHPRVYRKCELTTLWFVLMQIQNWSTKPSS
jgi:hypothetical protein